MDEPHPGLDAASPDTDSKMCAHCSGEAITQENGTPLCETHFQEYQVRHG